MQFKRPHKIQLSPDQLRWLGFAGLVLFVPGGLPVAFVLVVRHYREKLRGPFNSRFFKVAGR